MTIEGTKNFLAIQNATKASQIDRYLQETKGVGIDNANKAADNSLKRLAISNAEVDLVKNRISVTAARMGLTDQMLDIVSKRVAIDLKKNELDNALYDKQWYRESGLPTGFNNGLLNPLLGIGGAFNQVIKQIKRKGGK